jgi:hypothetical protein
VFDIHAPLCDPAFGPLLLWGIDDLWYTIIWSRAFRYRIPYDKFCFSAQGELIWAELF